MSNMNADFAAPSQLSQVMSPNAHDAVPGEASESAWMATLPRRGAADGGAQALQDGPQMKQEKMTLRPLNTGRPEAYENWRRATLAAVACRAGGDPMVMKYIEKIDDQDVPTEELGAAAQELSNIRSIDMHLYVGILECVEGPRCDAVLDRIHASVPLGHGCVALRALDREFQRSSARLKVAATAELLHLEPSSQGADAMDAFLARFRALLTRAGEEHVGPAAQIGILRKATAGHPVLGAVVAAWKHNDGANVRKLLESL